jgi:alpha-L-fucosidase 2
MKLYFSNLPIFEFMRRSLMFFIALALLFSACQEKVPPAPLTSGPELELWYDSPAEDWNQALPIGNGRLGAMVFGGTSQERIQLNEESVWTRQGSYEDRDGTDAIPQVRQLLFGGKYKEAQDLAVKELLQERLPTGTNAYQTLGDLWITYEDTSEVSGYKRSLRLDSALVRVNYSRNGNEYRREIFSSAERDVIFFRERAVNGGKIDCSIRLDRPGEGKWSCMGTTSSP